FAVLLTGKSVFRGIERGHLHAGREHAVHVTPTLAIDAGLIGNQPDSFASDRPKSILLPNVESRSHLAIARDFTLQTGARERFVIPGEAHAGRLDAQRCSDDGGDL